MTPRARLEVLRGIIAATPAAVVNLDAWVKPCGTVACAVGHACLSPTLQAEGLSLFVDHEDPHGAPAFGEHFAFGAVSAFFGLDELDAWMVFSPLGTGEIEYLFGELADVDKIVAEAARRLRGDGPEPRCDRAKVLARMDRALAST